MSDHNVTAHYSYPTAIQFGAGVRYNIPLLLQKTGLKRPLLVTDRQLVRLPPVTEMVELLQSKGVKTTLFSDISGNPVKSQVDHGVAAYSHCNADSIIAIGGGSALDVAKAIALMIHHPGDLFDYEDGLTDAPPIDRLLPLLIAIPTTAGTGSEVGRSAVISGDNDHIKKIIFSPRLIPAHVFADPELTLTLPAKITAATGMDALSHCIEAYLAPGCHPMCDGIALEGMRLIAGSLRQCVASAPPNSVHDGDQQQPLKYRGMMLNAAMMGAVAFQKGLGVTHSCAHALSTVCDMHHGLANGILLPYTMAFNEHVAAQRFRIMEQVVDTPAGTFVPWLKQLQSQIGIPATLADAGVNRDQLRQLATLAHRDVCHLTNPRPVSIENLQQLFNAAISGAIANDING